MRAQGDPGLGPAVRLTASYDSSVDRKAPPETATDVCGGTDDGEADKLANDRTRLTFERRARE